jgi:inosine-uridine nucleoside N-ribohydrolase
MARRSLLVVGIVLGVLVILFVLAMPAAPLWERLGVKPIYITGTWPHLRIVSSRPPATAADASAPSTSPGGVVPIPLVFDDDGSPDGVIALLYFLGNPLFDVRAVTVSCGEAHPDLFASRLVDLLAVLGRSDIPVGAGRNAPLDGQNAFPESWRQASDDFWDIPLPEASRARQPVPAAELIVQTILESEQPVLVFVSGTHTNLAEALRRQPRVAGRIRSVVIMGGSMYAPGNIESDWPSIHNRLAEWNIWADPVAAREVFASGLPLHLVPLDATSGVVWTADDARRWASSGLPGGRLAGDCLQWMLRTWSASGVFVWDLVAAVHAADPGRDPETSLSVGIVVAPGPSQGRTVAGAGKPNAAVMLEADAPDIKARAARILGR